MFCHKCGNKITERAGFCHKCGAKLVVEENTHQANIEHSVTQMASSAKMPLQASASPESVTAQENVEHIPAKIMDSINKLLEEAMSEAMTRCIICLIFGVFLALIGLLGLFGIAIVLIEGGDTETLVVALTMGLLITPVAVLSIIAAIKYRKNYTEVKKHKREAEIDPNYRLPNAMNEMVKAYERMGRKSTQDGKRALRELIRMFGA